MASYFGRFKGLKETCTNNVAKKQCANPYRECCTPVSKLVPSSPTRKEALGERTWEPGDFFLNVPQDVSCRNKRMEKA